MSSLIDIQSQIQKLQKQAEGIKAKEFQSTVQDILAKMQAFGITVKDLQVAKPAKAAKLGREKVSSAAAKVKRMRGLPSPINTAGPMVRLGPGAA
jgi:DNA-binding protein H-NS